LESANASIEILVIESAQKPTENWQQTDPMSPRSRLRGTDSELNRTFDFQTRCFPRRTLSAVRARTSAAWVERPTAMQLVAPSQILLSDRSGVVNVVLRSEW